MKKLLILTEGGKDVGLGHLARCFAVSQAARRLYPAAMVKFIVRGDARANSFFRAHKVNFLMKNWQEDIPFITEEVLKSDITVIDSYLAGKNLYYAAASSTEHLIMLDDYNRINYPDGFVVNPSVYGERIKYPVNPEITYLTGKEYVILRDEFRKVPEKKINKKAKRFLIAFGGMDHFEFSSRMAVYLAEKFNTEFTIMRPDRRIASPDEMIDTMLDADICISGGGQTIYELVRLGVPTVGVCLFDNQVMNLEGLENRKLIEYAGRKSDKDIFMRIERSVRKMLPSGIRKKHSVKCAKAIDGKGAERMLRRVMGSS